MGDAMNHDDPRYDDPDYDRSGNLIGAEPDHDDYDPIAEQQWYDEEIA